MTDILSGRRVLLGVAGGIAAYKAAHVVRGLRRAGADVRVVVTAASEAFVGRATWEALSGQPVARDVFEDVPHVQHVRLGQESDLILVVPATADLLARVRGGRADDLLAASLLVATCPVVLAPAMHTEMWLNAATRENVAVLRERGVHVIEPADGRLTGPDSGPGRLPEPEAVLAAARAVLAAPEAAGSLAGRRVVVSAGGTREALDPVRYLGNVSSGRQGWALAEAAVARGAEVDIVAANVDLEPVAGARVHRVTSAAELGRAVTDLAVGADAVVMAAAVADFRAAARSENKIKKDPDRDDAPVLELERTDDVLASLVARRRTQPDAGPRVIVGFAAETGDGTTSALEFARRKARAKGADLLVANDVKSRTVFGSTDNAVTVLDAAGATLTEGDGSKIEVAHLVWDAVDTLLPAR